MNKLIALLKSEPVAIYGTVVSALLVVLSAFGVDPTILTTVVTVATLLGIPVTRATVVPVAKAVPAAIKPVAPSETPAP